MAVLTDAAEFYRQAPDSVQRQLAQEMFEKVRIVDQRLMGVELARPYLELLGVEAAEGAAAVNEVPGSGQITNDEAQVTQTYLRLERPFGDLVAAELQRRDEQVPVSNLIQLVGCKSPPATTASQTGTAGWRSSATWSLAGWAGSTRHQ